MYLRDYYISFYIHQCLHRFPWMSLYSDKDNAEMGIIASCNTVKKRPTTLPNYVVKRKKKRSGLQRSIPYLRQLAEQSENDSEEVGSEVLEGSKLPEPPVQFKDIKSFVRFNILVDGMPIDSELSEDIRRKYFKLCQSQNAFLHDSLVKGINYNLIVGIILETVNIADAIKASKLTTTREEFSSWDQTLKAFEQLGMNVRFLRSRLRRIISLAYESEGAKSTRTYLEARNEQSRTEDEMRNIEGKLAELKEACDGFGAYIESLKSKSVRYEHKFQQEVTAPWWHCPLAKFVLLSLCYALCICLSKISLSSKQEDKLCFVWITWYNAFKASNILPRHSLSTSWGFQLDVQISNLSFPHM